MDNGNGADPEDRAPHLIVRSGFLTVLNGDKI